MTIKIDFERDTPYGTYRDALYLPDDHVYTPEEIAAMEQERVDNWIYVMENPAPTPSPDYVVIGGIIYRQVEVDGQIVLKPVEL